MSEDSDNWLIEFDAEGRKRLTPMEQVELDYLLAADHTTPRDLLTWGAKFLPHRISSGVSAFHRDLCPLLDSLSLRRGRKIANLAPRGSAKTTWATLAYPLRAALANDESYILLVGDTQTSARGFLDNIKREIETNESLEKEYPGTCRPGPVWNQDIIRLANGCEIEAISTGAAIRGRLKRTRPTLVIVDDPQGRDDVISAIERQHAWDWFTGDLLPLGEPRTNYIVNGTALHRESIVYRLNSTPGWDATVYKAIVAMPVNLCLWQEWENILHDNRPGSATRARTFYDANKTAMDAGSSVLWPERFPLYDLMMIRASGGVAAFEAEYQNNPTNPDLLEWPESYFDHAQFWFDEWPEDLAVKVVALDPSKGRSDKLGDYQATVKYGCREENGHMIEYVEGDMRRCGVEELCYAVMGTVKEFGPVTLALEATGFQSLLSIPLDSAAKALQTGCHITLVDQSVPKLVRIRRLTSALAQRRMRFKRGSAGTILGVNQMRDFPVGDHDDFPDCLEAAQRIAQQQWNGKGSAQPTRGRR